MKLFISLKQFQHHLQRSSLTFRNFCIKTSVLSSNDSEISNEIISFFTSRQISPENPTLKHLGTKITHEIVNFVLSRLNRWQIAHSFFSWASHQTGYNHSCYTYNAMAAILSRSHQSNLLRQLSDEVIASRCSMSPGALGFLLRCLGNLGLTEEANFLFDQARNQGLCTPNNYTFNCLLEAISKFPSSCNVVEIRLKEMKDLGWRYDKYTLTAVLCAYCNGGDMEKAFCVLGRIFEHGWADAHVISVMVVSLAKRSEVGKALDVVKMAESHKIELKDKTFCVLIHGFVKEGMVEDALHMFDKMLEAGCSPDIAVFDVLTGGLCSSSNIRKALDLCSRMEKLGVSLDIVILTKLLSYASEPDMVVLLEKRLHLLDSRGMNLAYNAVLRGLVANKSFEKALLLLNLKVENISKWDIPLVNLFAGNKSIHPDTTSFDTVIGGLCNAGMLEVALELFGAMAQAGCDKNVIIYNNLINEMCNRDMLVEAYDLLIEMKSCDFKPTPFTHNSIFGCLCRREDVLGAVKMAKEMHNYGHVPWIKHSTLLVKLLCKHERVADSCDFLTSMAEEGFVPDLVAYSAAINGLVNIHNVGGALELFNHICSLGYRPDVVTYNIMIKGLCRTQQMSEAEKILEKMWESGVVPSTITYNSLIDGWCKNGAIEKAICCLSKMSEKNREPDVVTYTTLISGLYDADRPDDSVKLWNEMLAVGCSPNRIAFMAAIRGLCNCGRPDEAQSYLLEMEAEGMEADSSVYVSLISAFISVLDPNSAFQTLKMMIEKGRIPNQLDKYHVLLKKMASKLLDDDQTCDHMKGLVAEGLLPISLVEDIVFADSGEIRGKE